MSYHTPVLLNESMDGLNIHPDGLYVDLTFGGGGHSREILKRLNRGKLIAFDTDSDAEENIIDDKRFTLLNHNFRYLKNFLTYYNSLPVHGILADLGVSSHHLDTAERGFSLRFNSRIDLRMDTNKTLDGCQVLNEYAEERLYELFRHYGEINNARLLAKRIVSNRSNEPVATINQLKEILQPLIPRGKENKYLAQVLQAIRIEVNQELESLKEMLLQAGEILVKGGRIVIISYHSLEDRLVKNFFKSGNLEGTIEKDFYGNTQNIFKIITKKPVTPGNYEIKENPRSRSAKMRIAEKALEYGK